MLDNALVTLERRAYGRDGDTIKDPDLMKACNEIRRLRYHLQEEKKAVDWLEKRIKWYQSELKGKNHG